MSENVVVLGASDNSERYSYKAMKALEQNGHKTFLVHPKLQKIEGRQVYSSIDKVNSTIDTLTVYVNPTLSSQMKDAIVKLHPKRVIFNPGTENTDLEKALNIAGIETERACTLVLLSTGQY